MILTQMENKTLALSIEGKVACTWLWFVRHSTLLGLSKFSMIIKLLNKLCYYDFGGLFTICVFFFISLFIFIFFFYIETFIICSSLRISVVTSKNVIGKHISWVKTFLIDPLNCVQALPSQPNCIDLN